MVIILFRTTVTPTITNCLKFSNLKFRIFLVLLQKLLINYPSYKIKEMSLHLKLSSHLLTRFKHRSDSFELVLI